MDRRSLLAGLGALAAAPLKAQETRWSAPVLDMHWHMRPAAAANLAHMDGCGETAANLLTRVEMADRARAMQARYPGRFPSWFAAADVTRPDAGALLTGAAKDGARGIGELKYHVAADGPEMRRIYELCAELDVPVLIHFQEVGQASAAGTYNAGIKRFGAVLKAHPRTRFIAHADAFWANISADYHEDTPYPTGPVVPGGISDRLLSDYPNIMGDLASNSGNNALSRDPAFTEDFLRRHQERLMFGSDCNCTDGHGGGAAQSSPAVAPRMRGKCVARETLTLLTARTTPAIFRKLVWENGRRLLKLPA
jgi:predicted TIM-barrel fold metal-dependent hydrolase